MFLNIAQLNVHYPGQTGAAVDGVSLGLRAGDIGVLIGPSGCGKTTLLRAVAGLERASAGSITLDGECVSDARHHLPAEKRRIGMVFQDYALFPHLDVGRNVAFGIAKLPRAERETRVAEMLKLVGLDGLQTRYPHELSGGQQQRVALARSLAKGPKLLLLDEPMGALDKKLRSQMQIELVNIIETSGVTCVMVTHDQEEAMTMATRIAVMDQGWIQQIGKPDDIYEQPANRFVAGFIGSVNLFEGVIDEDLPEYVTVRTADFPAPIYVGHGITGYEGQPVAFALRPEKVHIAKDEPAGDTNKAFGVVEDIAYFGSHSVYHVRLPSGAKILSNFANMKRWDSDGITWNDEVWVSWDDNDGVVLTS